MVEVLKRMIQPTESQVYDTYWKFASERLTVFYRRLEKPTPPWTDDVILQKYKFTNAYRAADRVSQYLINSVICTENYAPRDLMFRILLFKIFNKIDTWKKLENIVGPISWSGYDFDTYVSALNHLKTKKQAIYSAAYIMASGKSAFGYNMKHENHLKLIEKMIFDGFTEKVMQEAQTMQGVYHELLSYPSIGSFLAYQFATDINYSPLTNFSEMEFVKAGPGAKDGIRKCFTNVGEYSEEDIIRMMAERQNEEFDRLGIDFPGLWGRPLQLIDCQNLFCEVDKYARVSHPEVNGISGRSRIKQKFSPTSLTAIHYQFPADWELETSGLPNLKYHEQGA